MSSQILKSIAFFSFLLVILSITQLNGKKVFIKRSVYYWKKSAIFSQYSVDSLYPQFIESHKIKTVYIKMLDVDWVFKRGIIIITKTILSEYSDGLEFLEPDKLAMHRNLSYYDKQKENI
jgi:hypothetical protein